MFSVVLEIAVLKFAHSVSTCLVYKALLQSIDKSTFAKLIEGELEDAFPYALNVELNPDVTVVNKFVYHEEYSVPLENSIVYMLEQSFKIFVYDLHTVERSPNSLIVANFVHPLNILSATDTAVISHVSMLVNVVPEYMLVAFVIADSVVVSASIIDVHPEYISVASVIEDGSLHDA